MTIPTGPGASPFDYGDETVAARVSVDVPQDALNNLNQLTTQTGDLRANMEATARFTGNFIEYLKQLPEIMAQAENAGARMSGALQARGGGIGSGRNDATSTLWGADTPGTGAGRTGAGDPAAALEHLRQTDPRQYANLLAQQQDQSSTERVIINGGDDVPAPRQTRRAQPGSSGPGNRGTGNRGPSGRNDSTSTNDDPNWIDRAQQYQQRSDRFLDNVINESRSGQNRSVFDTAGTAVRGAASSARNFQQQQEERARAAQERADDRWLRPEDRAAAQREAQVAGRLSSASGIAMRGAGVAGVAVGAGVAVQKVGEQYQNYVAQGSQRGGGAAEGFAFEAQVRTMAMNPFISLEQSRKIMQSALSQGYTGKEFDTVTDFMAENLKKMNVDVATSTKILQEQVTKGGQSIESAQTDLTTTRALSANDNAVKTADQFTEQVQAGVGIAMESGADGLTSTEYGQATASVFSEDTRMKDFSSVLQQAANDPVTQSRIAGAVGYSGELSGALGYALEQEGGAQTAINTQLADLNRIAQQYIPLMSDPMKVKGAVKAFMASASSAGYKLSQDQAKFILEKAMDGTLLAEGGKAGQRVDDAAGAGPLESPSGASRAGGLAKGSLGVAQVAGGGLLKGLDWAFRFGTGDSNDSPVGKFANGVLDAGLRNFDEGGAASGTASTNARITGLVDSYGSRNVKVMDDQGKESDLADLLGDEGQQKAIADGRSKIKVPGADDFTTLVDLNKQQDAEKAAGSTGGGLFDLTAQAAELLKLLPVDDLNQNQRSSNSGEDGATRNTAPAGVPPGGR